MDRPTFRQTLGNDWIDWETTAEEILRTPLGYEMYTGDLVVHLFDHSREGWQKDYQQTIAEHRERRAWARQFLADRAAYYERGPDGYSEADLRAEADSIKEDERRMREDHERDIVRGLGGRWWD